VLLTSDEIFNLNEILPFKNSSLKAILARFLFSCFTGLISDITRISPENIVGDTIFFLQKTGKIQRIQLNESALSFIGKRDF
jgi:hypothetical protein